MKHTEKFQKLADDAKAKITEISIAELSSLLKDRADRHQANHPLLIDVREESEWNISHLGSAVHLSRGVIEIKIEAIAPDPNTPIICYCGGGNRSALVAESLQKMGYTDVKSLIGGFKAWEKAELPTLKNLD